MLRRTMVALLALGSMVAPATAQTPTVAESEEIVVTGRRLEEAVRSFVDGMTAPDLPEDQIARWNSRYCPLVTGIRTRQARFLIDRMASRAIELDLQPGEPNCRANILIMFTADADGAARAFSEERAFMAYYSNSENGNSLGREALRRFSDSDAPVRWWHVAQTVTRDGDVIGAGGETVRGQASRLQRNTRQDFSRVVVVVDSAQLRGIQLAALADYLAMVTLAQLDAEAQTAQFPTILNMFSERDRGAPLTISLTDWDRAYLRGLYEAPRLAPNSHAQENAISETVQDELRQ